MPKPKILYKSLPADMAPHGHKFIVGKWHKISGTLKICSKGFHASENIIDAMGFVNAEVLAKVEVRGESIVQDNKQCWSEMKIIKAYEWTKKDSVSLAVYAAELVIGIYEKEYPNDKRPRQAIEAAKAWLKNPTEKNSRAAARAAEAAWAAEAAAEAAAGAAARAAEAAARAAEAAARAAGAAARAAGAAARAAWAAGTSVKEKCATFVIKRAKL